MRDISIVIPTYNSAKTIEPCLDSIIRQTDAPREILVVDRNSTDGTPEIARKFGARVIPSKANRSLGRNIGLNQSSSRGMMFIDADMRLAPSLVRECSEQLEHFQALVIPEVSIGEGFWTTCRSLERRTYWETEIEAARCFDRLSLLSLGGYNPNLESGEDWDLHYRAKSRGLSIGRTNAKILHDERNGSLIRLLRKKYQYGTTIADYAGANPQSTKVQLNPLSRILEPTLRTASHDPVHGAGVLVLKTLEFAAGGAGWLSSRANPKFRQTSSRRERRALSH